MRKLVLFATALLALASAAPTAAADGPCSIHGGLDLPQCVGCLANPPSEGCFVQPFHSEVSP